MSLAANRVGWLLFYVLLMILPARAEDKVNVKVVKYADLAATVRQAKGKIVVVDFWASW
jgi:hypothetical protein